MPVGRRRGRQLLDGGVEQAAMLGVAQFLGRAPCRRPRRPCRRSSPRSRPGPGRGPGRCRAGARCLASSASAWACLIDLVGRRLGLLPRLVEDAPHLVGGPGHQLAVLGQIGLALVAGPLGLQQDVLQVLLAAVQRRQERLPGEPRQNQEQQRRRRPPSRSPGLARPSTGLIGASGGTPVGFGRSLPLLPWAAAPWPCELAGPASRLARARALSRHESHEPEQQRPFHLT